MLRQRINRKRENEKDRRKTHNFMTVLNEKGRVDARLAYIGVEWEEGVGQGKALMKAAVRFRGMRSGSRLAWDR